jgi:xylan 1,4-beta-xylosidase
MMGGSHPTIDVRVMKSHKMIQVLIANSVLPKHPVATEKISIELRNVLEISRAIIERIDDKHCNTRSAWAALGSPGTLKPYQVRVLEKVSELVKETQSFLYDDLVVKLEVEMPPPGTALLMLKLV